MTNETICLIGASGRTGKETLKLALAKGYSVRALVRTPAKIGVEHENLSLIQGSFEDIEKLEQVISGADYVLCMAAASSRADGKYPDNFMLSFVKTLIPLMQKSPPKVFLYQAGSMSTDGNGYLHPIAFLAKHIVGRKLQIFPKIKDNDEAIQYIAKHVPTDEFHFIVTRAGFLQDEPSERDLVTSDWPPIPYVYATFVDLAELSLKAIKDESLYDTCPFVR